MRVLLRVIDGLWLPVSLAVIILTILGGGP